MGEVLLNKVFFVILCMSALNVGKHIFEVIKRLREEVPEKYSLTKREKLFLGLSISFIITTIFTGITL